MENDKLAQLLQLCKDLNIRPVQEDVAAFQKEQATTATQDRISIRKVIESASNFASSNDLFSEWFFGESAIEELVDKIKQDSKACAQTRDFIGLVQATMMGKTRLLLEASKRTPMIIIRLDKTNVVYKRLCSYVSVEKKKVTREASFNEWRAANQRVLLFIRLFFLSYMRYAAEFQEDIGSCLFDPQTISEAADKIRLFNASLLNGGQPYVCQIFEEEVVAHLQQDDGLKAAVEKVRKRHQTLAAKLHWPTLALDECHLPRWKARGLLFHSDFKNHLERTNGEQDVLAWQRYEFWKTENKPAGYNYAAQTMLFSGFRWVLKEYLMQPGERQTTIFASTFFSVWEPLLDEATYSREKPRIFRVYLNRMLSLDDMLVVLRDRNHSSTDCHSEEVKAVLSKWCGRPGFFFDSFLPQLDLARGTSSLYDKVMIAHKRGEQDLIENVFDPALAKLSRERFIRTSPEGVAITGDEVVLFLHFCCRIRGGNIKCLSSDLAEIVSAGFAIVKDYIPGPEGLSHGVIAEPLVQAYLSRKARDEYGGCDRYIAHMIKSAAGTSYGNLAEYALANAVVSFHGRPLQDLLNAWLRTPMPMTFLDNLSVNVEAAVSVDDLGISATDFVLHALRGRLILPLDGIVMPDACFFSSDGEENYCLVTVQSKVTQAKLSPAELAGAIKSTSIDKIFTQKNGFRTPQAIQFQANWNAFLKSVRSVHFVRVLVCAKGWTGSQIAAIAAHNKQHPTQPILLADPMKSDSLFGILSAKALADHVGRPAQRMKEATGLADPAWVIPAQWAEWQPSDGTASAKKTSGKKKANAKKKTARK